MTKKNTRNFLYNIFAIIGGMIVMSPVVILLFCVYLAKIGSFGELPDFQELENPETNLATEIISIDNSWLPLTAIHSA